LQHPESINFFPRYCIEPAEWRTQREGAVLSAFLALARELLNWFTQALVRKAGREKKESALPEDSYFY
jgi:hypothetical protein